MELPTYSAENCLTMDLDFIEFLVLAYKEAIFQNIVHHLSSQGCSIFFAILAHPSMEQNHIGQFIRKLDSLSCFLSFNTSHKRMDHIRVHRLFWHLHQRIHRHMKVLRNFMKFNRVDCSCTIHNFAHCLLGDSNSFCQINLLFIFFFQFSLNVVAIIIFTSSI